MPKLPVVKFREFFRILERSGFSHVRTSGSHFYFRNKATKVTISLPNHGPKPLGKGLVKSILNDASISVEDFTELLKK